MSKEPDLLDQEVPQGDEKESLRWHVRLLGLRVATLTKEKEKLELENTNLWIKFNDLEKKVDRALNRGAGMLFVLPVFGIFVGWMIAFGSKFFRTGS